MRETCNSMKLTVDQKIVAKTVLYFEAQAIFTLLKLMPSRWWQQKILMPWRGMLVECNLPFENENSTLTKSYSQTRCEFECAIANISRQCECIPWNFPAALDSNLTFCSTIPKSFSSSCIKSTLSYFSPQQCQCLPDCSETTFGIFDTRIALDGAMLDKCRFFDWKFHNLEFPYNILCHLCFKIIRDNRIKFVYETIVHGEPDTGAAVFCATLIKENFAFVKVEMATKSITKTVKDQRFNFVSKVSALGEFFFWFWPLKQRYCVLLSS